MAGHNATRLDQQDRNRQHVGVRAFGRGFHSYAGCYRNRVPCSAFFLLDAFLVNLLAPLIYLDG